MTWPRGQVLSEKQCDLGEETLEVENHEPFWKHSQDDGFRDPIRDPRRVIHRSPEKRDYFCFISAQEVRSAQETPIETSADIPIIRKA